MCRKAVSCKKNLTGDGFLIGKGSIRVTSLAAQPSCCKSGDVKSRYKMRITFPCPDFKGYLENPIIFLPEKVNCVRNPDHCTHRNGHWQRQIAVDYVSTTTMSLYRLYCLDCGESISLWPEFVLPYQREPVEPYQMKKFTDKRVQERENSSANALKGAMKAIVEEHAKQAREKAGLSFARAFEVKQND